MRIICETHIIFIQFQLDVAATGKSFFKILRINLVVTDINDHTPAFEGEARINFFVLESSTIGTSLALSPAVDKDSRQFSLINYKLHEYEDEAYNKRNENKWRHDYGFYDRKPGIVALEWIFSMERINIKNAIMHYTLFYFETILKLQVLLRSII